jgi:superfamily I DNA and RNA helicase
MGLAPELEDLYARWLNTIPREYSPHFYNLTHHLNVEQLTADQQRVSRLLRGHRHARVSGIAGSGKTLIAAHKAVLLDQADLDVLFLCHNPLLKQFVEHLTEGSGVEVQEFCEWTANAAGEPRVPQSRGWTNSDEPSGGTLSKAFDRIFEFGPHYDVVIVDEGQDFP